MNYICENQKCQKPHDGTFGSGRFCSKSCSKSHPKSEETKERLRQWAKKNPKGFVADPSKSGDTTVPRITRICKAPNCNNIFETTQSRNKIYCSPKCSRNNSGGLRQGSGVGKSGYYKGFFLRSTYELAYLIYCLEYNIDIKPCKEVFEYIDPKTNKTRKYYPDFIINDTIIEIKGYKSEIDLIKANSVNKPYQILYKNDLNDVFNYVEIKTGLKIENLYQLYEDKEKYTKICNWCDQEYLTIKENQQFCSKRCSMLNNRQLCKKFQ